MHASSNAWPSAIALSSALAIDGRSCEALAGDTLLTALLTNGRRLRSSEFGDGVPRGLLSDGLLQDCWVALEDGTRLRACTSFVADGMRVVTRSDADMSARAAPERESAPKRVARRVVQ